MSLEKENKNYIKDSHILTGETLQAESESNKNVTKASEILGYELVSMLKISKDDLDDSEVPLWVEQNVLKAYNKDYRYRIIWRTVKMKAIEFKEALFANGRGLEVALAATTTLFILGGIIYYQYTKFQKLDPTNTIVNQESPKSNVLPSPTVTPVITLNPEDITSSDIDTAKNNFNKDKMKTNPTIEKNNNKKSSLVKSNKQNFEKRNNEDLPKSYEKEDIAKNEFPKFTDPSESQVSLSRAVTLEDINSIYLGDLPQDQWFENLKTELKMELQKYWNTKEVAKEAKVGFRFREGQGLTLLDRNTNEIIWQKLDFVIGKGEPKTIAKEIISELVDLVNKNKKDTK